MFQIYIYNCKKFGIIEGVNKKYGGINVKRALLAMMFATCVFVAGCSVNAKNTFKALSANQVDIVEEEENEKVQEEVEYQFEKPKKGDIVATIKTNHGDIKVKMLKDIAPKAVENFVGLANKGYYDGVIFHRVIKDFMIQGGDPTGTGAGGSSIWEMPFEDEFSDRVHHYRGALSMANRGPDTNTSQFFIVHNEKLEPGLITYLKRLKFDEELLEKYMQYGGTPHLDGKHTIFGQVYEGIEVVDKIANVEVLEDNRPVEEVTILEVTIENIE